MDASKLVFVDETAARCSMNRLYGWAPTGETPVIKRCAHGKRLSIVGAIALDGTRAHMTYTGTMNGDRMVEFVKDEGSPGAIASAWRCGRSRRASRAPDDQGS